MHVYFMDIKIGGFFRVLQDNAVYFKILKNRAVNLYTGDLVHIYDHTIVEAERSYLSLEHKVAELEQYVDTFITGGEF